MCLWDGNNQSFIMGGYSSHTWLIEDPAGHTSKINLCKQRLRVGEGGRQKDSLVHVSEGLLTQCPLENPGVHVQSSWLECLWKGKSWGSHFLFALEAFPVMSLVFQTLEYLSSSPPDSKGRERLCSLSVVWFGASRWNSFKIWILCLPNWWVLVRIKFCWDKVFQGQLACLHLPC